MQPSDECVRPLVIGAGPAGLTAAYELSRRGITSHVLEAHREQVGGLSQTASYRGFRFDIGGHRFFSKSASIEQMWSDVLGDDLRVVPRLSRILYDGRFFGYPLRPWNALRTLGFVESIRCMLSYAAARAWPRPDPASFEDWVINQFGERLYRIFFKTYTEKVWGMPCREISADWAAQRIQGLNLWRAVLGPWGGGAPVAKTLVERFRYPRLGPGMLWERLSEQVAQAGSQLHMDAAVASIRRYDGGFEVVTCRGERFSGTHVISTMPLRELVAALDPKPPQAVIDAARSLRYRDFLTVVAIVDVADVFPDQWIYVHDPGVRVGRIQNYKRWSPEMVADPSLTSLGLEYFCFEGDDLWLRDDGDLLALARRELALLGIVAPDRVVDGTVVRVPKAYPVYDEGYRQAVAEIRAYLESSVPGLQVVGRNGMHRYNNQDHAMMTGMLAARNVLGEAWDVWRVNGDAAYIEGSRDGEALGPGAETVAGRRVPRRIG